ncbi:hypothetical protein Nepgr_010861 [Nepenthes gracilis]|uniref:Uncharacterized protein n=1 Tax=Nepenthes gracilis TaxID=150966 RepID=A0AAD3SDZ7_NEPGR|nr:hypothetical protein Nepgr_010861 [Nepenthes gracilis]
MSGYILMELMLIMVMVLIPLFDRPKKGSCLTHTLSLSGDECVDLVDEYDGSIDDIVCLRRTEVWNAGYSFLVS